MLPALIVALPLAGAALPAAVARAGGLAAALAAGLVTSAALVLLASAAPSVLAGTDFASHAAWLPTLGLDLSFRLDGLSLMFAGMILVIGLLVILYAWAYLPQDGTQGRFFALLLLFQGAMLGIVLSDNLLLTLVFWEMTSLASFLLIGFRPQGAAARAGARTALAVTGAGGLALLAGFLMLGHIAGTYRISEILTRADTIAESGAALPALILILLGAFTKSAQVPFHFWLPGAMAAPTPVSAYLHSATMVKAGIFLLARFWPALSGLPEWGVLVTGAGVATMLLGAGVALMQTDIKALLAWSTLSHLGLITMLLGFGTETAAVAALAHILAHATFKAALFMVAGIVDHQTYQRDLRQLGGLARALPVTTVLAILGGLAMAGVPPLNGYLSKELMLAEAAMMPLAGVPWAFAAAGTLSAALAVACALRFVVVGFFGQPRSGPAPEEANLALWAAPAVLAALALVSGVVPMTLAGGLITSAAEAVTGGATKVYITHWHGLGAPALWLSLAAWGGGLVAFGALAARQVRGTGAPTARAQAAFDVSLHALTRIAGGLTQRIFAPSATQALALIVAVVLVAGGAAFVTAPHSPGTRPLTAAGPVAVVALILLVAASAAAVLLHRDRLTALVLTGLVGLIVAMGFATLSAPDLALTQIVVDVVTVLLLLLALTFLPHRAKAESTLLRQGRDGALGLAAGIGAGALSLALMTRELAAPGISAYHTLNAKPLGGGTNVVNVILVDFRGFDTFGEITVLGIAALVIHAAARGLQRPGAASRRLHAMNAARSSGRHGDAAEGRPLLLMSAMQLLLPLMLLVGAFLFLRGHNLPGGGFISGLVVAIAVLMQNGAAGLAAGRMRTPVHPATLIGGGVLVAVATGAGAFWHGMPFLTSDFTYLDLPLLEPVELATAALFDLGVFLTVLGAVLLSLIALARLAHHDDPDAGVAEAPVAKPPVGAR